ncbi:transposase (plasmid) [Shinella sp. WSC3-e]|nr:transposase [Shinella sp. WSC3-e]
MLPPCLMNFPRPNGCWPTVAMMPTGIVTLYRRRGSLPAFQVENPARRPSNTTNAATNGATGSRSCSGVSKTGDRGSQYVSIRYSERLAEAGIEPSVGSVGDSYDNALAETINGLYKAEV